MKKMFIKEMYKHVFAFLLFCLSAFISISVQGNNIRINAPVKVSAGTGDTLVLEFPLQWDNSWRDEFNWDAAWVFLKYKVGTGDWKHVPLSFGGHSFNGSSGQPVHFDYMSGQTGSNTLGVFVYRSRSESGNTPEIICKLKCLKSALGGITPEKFDDHEAFIRAQGVEMVYVPYGAYYLGDNASNKSFTGIEKALYGPIPESSDIVNNTSGYTITASNAAPGCVAPNAADHINDPIHGVNSWYSQTTNPCWWKIDFKAGKTVRFFGVSGAMSHADHAPNGVWYLEGSNDDVNWTKLNTIAASTWRAPSVSYPVQQSIRVANPGYYRYYRLSFLQHYYTMAQNIAMTEDLLYPLDNVVGDLVDSENARSLNIGSSAISVPEAFPKGYKGFYTMKYELSQEQYVAFLNTLTYAQQQERVPGLALIKEGDYIFGDHSQPSNRNGICVAVASFNGLPVIFANNLTNDKKYAQDNDGKTVACNYLSPNDMLGYCSWSGLRPMSELEYEKACRPAYPEMALPKGYAWNGATVSGHLASVSNAGQRNEVSATAGANVNAGNTFGPVRCGLFATSASNQQTAGATFWGVMEMSGNLRELCYNIGAASTFNGSVLGDGTYAVNKWNNTVANFGVRGGGFTSNDDLLCVSDRTEATDYFTALEQHDSTVAFRGVRPVGDGITVTQGNLLAKVNGSTVSTVCPSDELELSTDAVAQALSGGVAIPNMAFTYVWYVLKPGSPSDEIISSATGAVLRYKDFSALSGAASTYKFKRKAICPLGEVTSGYITLTVPNMTLALSSTSTQIDACDNSAIITASVPASGATYEWTYDGTSLSSINTYIPSRSHFSGGSGNYSVKCTVSASGCSSVGNVNIYIRQVQTVPLSGVNMSNCGEVLFNYEGTSYCTAKIGTQCWMGKNLNVGTIVNSADFNTHTTAGVQKICYNNLTTNCDVYGGLYNWFETIYGDNAGSIKYTPGSTTQIQGICPDGWHVPDDKEWSILENYLGGSDVAGGKMKSPIGWSSPIGATNESGFSAIAGGCRNDVSNRCESLRDWGHWWTATSGTDRNMCSGAVYVLRYATYYTSAAFSVRCVKN